MSFNLPPVKAKPELTENVGVKEGQFGVPDVMTYGLRTIKSDMEIPHPIMALERNYHKNRLEMNMALLRNTQGLHAPLRLAMEMRAAKEVGRLPFLPSSNVMLDVLTGRDLEIGPEDIFNTPEFREVAGQPHAMIERSLGIL